VTLWDVGVERQIDISGPDAFEFTNLLEIRELDGMQVVVSRRGTRPSSGTRSTRRRRTATASGCCPQAVHRSREKGAGAADHGGQRSDDDVADVTAIRVDGAG
jgi:hypothetical protein